MGQGVARQIIGSFEDIGKDVLKQTAQVPKDIVGKALESLGTSGSSKQGQQFQQGQQDGAKSKEGPLGQFDAAKDEQTKKAIARSALEQLAGKPKQKEPSVWEKIQQEMEQKKQQQQQQAQQQSAQQLPSGKGKRPRGDLYGLKAKKASAEMSRNVRQD